MKIGIVCDSHMPNSSKSAQWQFCEMGACVLKNDGISHVITVGDITSFGEIEAFDAYMNMFSGFSHYAVLGNSDARDAKTVDEMMKKCPGFRFDAEGRTVLGINTAHAKITPEDKEALSALKDGDIVVMHHPVGRLHQEEDHEFMTKLCEEKSLVILCAHLHRKLYSEIGRSKAFGMRAIDPDKSFGDFPCVTYFDTETDLVEEKLIYVSKETILELRKYFGISCVDNHRDVEYAIENKLYGIELRCNGKGWEPDFTLVEKIEKWRSCGGKYLSVHMPNLHWREGALVGAQTWCAAVEYAKAVGADGLTMHPPRVKLCDYEESAEEFLKLYKFAADSVDARVNIGIENLHMTKGETCDADRAFGYIPEEVASWREKVREATENTAYIGHTIDVGHARNNGYLASKYPISRWYEAMGEYATAYHIHQVMMKEEGLKNHNAIEDWFGPQISYVSFFKCWENGTINKSPIFLEVKGAENFEKSVRAFDKAFGAERG